MSENSYCHSDQRSSGTEQLLVDFLAFVKLFESLECFALIKVNLPTPGAFAVLSTVFNEPYYIFIRISEKYPYFMRK